MMRCLLQVGGVTFVIACVAQGHSDVALALSAVLVCVGMVRSFTDAEPSR